MATVEDVGKWISHASKDVPVNKFNFSQDKIITPLVYKEGFQFYCDSTFPMTRENKRSIHWTKKIYSSCTLMLTTQIFRDLNKYLEWCKAKEIDS